MNSKEFSLKIESIVKDKRITYMDAVIDYCNNNDIDLGTVNPMINKSLKEKKSSNNLKSSQAILIGLDKITAKSTKLVLNLNETKKFGPLEIQILKCGKVKVNNKIDSVAYMKVKDLTKNEDDQVFIFNGWTFASDPSLTPFDHAIYDLQLKNCRNT